MLPLLSLVTGWLLFLSLAGVIGVVVGRWIILPSDSDDVPGRAAGLRTSTARLGRGAALLLFVALGLVLLRQLIEFHDPFSTWAEDAWLLLARTAWGTTWLIAVAVTGILLASLWLAARQRGFAWWPATVAALAMGSFPALTGHANTGDPRALALLTDTLHVWAMGAWIGGLGLVLFLERRRCTPDRPSVLPVLVPRFSPVAMASVATLAATGAFASWVHLDGVGALFTTMYGGFLLVKLVLVAGVLALGAVNFKRLTPTLDQLEGQSAMRRSATLEFVLANVVLAVTAILVRTSPM